MGAFRAVGTACKSIAHSICRTYGTANQSVKQFSTNIAYLKARFPDVYAEIPHSENHTFKDKTYFLHEVFLSFEAPVRVSCQVQQ
jgi:hypothetical protein